MMQTNKALMSQDNPLVGVRLLQECAVVLA